MMTMMTMMVMMSVSLTDLIVDASELLNNNKTADNMSFDRTMHVCECDPNVPECANPIVPISL